MTIKNVPKVEEGFAIRLNLSSNGMNTKKDALKLQTSISQVLKRDQCILTPD